MTTADQSLTAPAINAAPVDATYRVVKGSVERRWGNSSRPPSTRSAARIFHTVIPLCGVGRTDQTIDLNFDHQFSTGTEDLIAAAH